MEEMGTWIGQIEMIIRFVSCSPFRNQVEKRTILENYESLLLALDEFLDKG